MNNKAKLIKFCILILIINLFLFTILAMFISNIVFSLGERGEDMILLKTLFGIIFVSASVSLLYFSYVYSFTALISERWREIVEYIIKFLPLICLYLPLEKGQYAEAVRIFRIIVSLVMVKLLFHDWNIVILVSLCIIYLYYPVNVRKSIVIKMCCRVIICIFFLGYTAFTLYFPIRLEWNRYMETHQVHEQYVNIILAMETASISKGSIDFK